MKLFSATIEGVYGRVNIIRSLYVIADSKEEALGKIEKHIDKSPKLSQTDITSVIISEEAVVV
jgi:hypothetical protein